MAWTAPMTAVANTIFTAAQFNTHVRDNLNETAPAKVTAASRYVVSTGLNAIAQRECFRQVVATAQSTSSTSYTDLATPGPSVAAASGAKVLVFISCGISNDTTNAASIVSYEISGATSRVASDAEALQTDGVNANNTNRVGIISLAEGLTPGVNTFTMKYRVGSGVGTFENRQIVVLPF